MKEMPWLLLIIVWIVNFGISWWNAYACGKSWVETKHLGGWERFMCWMGAIMSASGFTWCYLLVLLLGGYYAQQGFIQPGHAPILSEHAIQAGLSLGYLILIPGILFSGMMIWLDSLMRAWRRRDLPSIGIAAWNTYAQIHNTYSAFSGIPGALKSIKGFCARGSKNSKGLAVVLIIVLVVFAILGGVFTTWGIISHYAATEPLPSRRQEGAQA
jgi:hypothetical protein